MDYNTKRKVADRVIYIVLAAIAVVTMLAIIVVSVTTAAKRNEKPPVTDAPITKAPLPIDTARPDITPQTAPSDSTTAAPETDSEVIAPVDGIEDLPVVRPQTLPVQGYLIKEYSYELPVYSLTMNDYRVHAGIDISAAQGDPVYAFMSGVVTEVSSDYFMGTCITVDHGDGLVSRYMNISEQLPANIGVGAEVDCGQLIASVKDTALIEAAEECHLHFEIMKDGKYVDPLGYVSYDAQVMAYED